MSVRKAPRGLVVLSLAVLLRLVPNVQALEMPGVGDVARQTSAAVNEQAAETISQAEALLALSEQQNKEQHDDAIQTALRALALWEAVADKDGIARTYAHIGRCYQAKSELPEAIQNFERALQLWGELNEPLKQADVLISLAFIESRKGEWRDSISLHSRAQGVIGSNEAPFLRGRIAGGLANVFNESGLHDTALIQYQQALEYFRQTPDTRDDMLVIWAIGSTYYLKGNYAEALLHLRQALDSVAPDSPLDAALCHEYLGRVYISTREYDVALQHLQAALPIYTKAVNPKEAAQVIGLMGHIYQQRGQLEPSRRYYRQALETFTRLSDQINQAAIYYELGWLELKAENYAAAEEYLELSIKVTENLRRLSTGRDLTAAFSATVHERYEKYIECLMRQRETQPERDLGVLAFEVSEQSRARSLAELLRATQTDLVPGLDPELAGREKTLRQSLRIKEDRRVALLGGGKDKKEELAALEAELARLEVDYKQLTEAIRSRHPSYGEITRPVAWSLRRIQEQVIADDDTVLLEYSLGEDKSYVWAVTRDSVTSYEIPARALITESARKVYKSLAMPARDAAEEFTPAAQELVRMVLSPVAAELNKRRLIVVADGALHYIPFQVLPAPSPSHEPLVASHEVVNAPSATILGELRQGAARRRPASKVLAAFGDPVFATDDGPRKDAGGGGGLLASGTLEDARLRHAWRDVELDADSLDPSTIPRLFYAKRELAYLLDVASGGEAFVATDFAATRERLLSTNLTQYAILHFATHGFLDPQRPEHSGLILSTVDGDGKEQNGFVSLQDIYQLRAPTDLVVLSACRTALGKDVRGEGLLSLTRGFMYAGASSVVASLWKVDDEATAELMKQFYTNMLKDGMTPAQALRAAQNSVRQNPDWGSPHYWAAFTLQGEYRQIIKPASAAGTTASYWKMMAGGGALLALLAGAAWWYFRRRRAARARA